MGCSSSQQVHTPKTSNVAVPVPPELGLPVRRLSSNVDGKTWYKLDRDEEAWERDYDVDDAIGLHSSGQDSVSVDLPRGGTLVIPKGIKGTLLTEDEPKLEFGSIDEQTNVFTPATWCKFTPEVADQKSLYQCLQKAEIAKIKALLSGDNCHWRLSIPLLELYVKKETARFDWVEAVTQGAEVMGQLVGTIENLRNVSVTQLGGAHFDGSEYERRSFMDILKHLPTWKDQTKTSPRTWETIRVGIKKKFTDLQIADQAKRRAHLVVFGVAGSGKSSFLNAVSQQSASTDSKFGVGHSTDAVTQRVETRDIVVDRFNGASSLHYSLTDVPGFEDTARVNANTCEELQQHLQESACGEVDAFILVINLSEHRAKEGLMKSIEAMQHSFGEAMWNRTILVLTHVKGAMKSQQGDYASARKWLRDELPKKRAEWVAQLTSRFPASASQWMDMSKTVFSIDSETLTEFKRACSLHLEQKDTSTVVDARRVREELYRLIPDSVFRGDHLRRPSEKEQPLQWKDKSVAALLEHSMEQLSQFRECMELKQKRKTTAPKSTNSNDIRVEQDKQSFHVDLPSEGAPLVELQRLKQWHQKHVAEYTLEKQTWQDEKVLRQDQHRIMQAQIQRLQQEMESKVSQLQEMESKVSQLHATLNQMRPQQSVDSHRQINMQQQINQMRPQQSVDSHRQINMQQQINQRRPQQSVDSRRQINHSQAAFVGSQQPLIGTQKGTRF